MVPIELAEMANKIGFKENTRMLYEKETGRMTNKWVPSHYKCPTISELSNWIRKNHSINIYVRIFGDKWAAYVEEVPTGIEITPRLIEMSEYDSFEECLCYAMIEVMKDIFEKHNHDDNNPIQYD